MSEEVLCYSNLYVCVGIHMRISVYCLACYVVEMGICS